MLTLEQIEELERLSEVAKREPWYGHAVSGDAMQYDNPNERLHLNTNMTWFVGPKMRSRMQAEKYLAYIEKLTQVAPDLFLAARQLLESKT